MIINIKSFVKRVIPERSLNILYSYKPSIQTINTYILKKDQLIEPLSPIDSKFSIISLDIEYSEELRAFYGDSRSFQKNILPRLTNTAWTGLAVFDSSNNKIAYVSWVIKENTSFIKEFKITLLSNQFFLRHGYCSPEYRHQGLHTRMEQERINYSIKHGATELYIQIGSKNNKGQSSVLNNGFIFQQKDYLLRIAALGIYRELFSFLQSPFKRVI